MAGTKGISQFAIYEKLVGEAGLYGQAFFGHKATRQQRKMLDKLQKRSMYLWKERRANIEQIEAAIARENKAKVDQASHDSS